LAGPAGVVGGLVVGFVLGWLSYWLSTGGYRRNADLRDTGSGALAQHLQVHLRG
jgi:NhaP-type Na+/H+ or K+/H+ antiporter